MPWDTILPLNKHALFLFFQIDRNRFNGGTPTPVNSVLPIVDLRPKSPRRTCHLAHAKYGLFLLPHHSVPLGSALGRGCTVVTWRPKSTTGGTIWHATNRMCRPCRITPCRCDFAFQGFRKITQLRQPGTDYCRLKCQLPSKTASFRSSLLGTLGQLEEKMWLKNHGIP